MTALWAHNASVKGLLLKFILCEKRQRVSSTSHGETSTVWSYGPTSSDVDAGPKTASDNAL